MITFTGHEEPVQREAASVSCRYAYIQRALKPGSPNFPPCPAVFDDLPVVPGENDFFMAIRDALQGEAQCEQCSLELGFEGVLPLFFLATATAMTCLCPFASTGPHKMAPAPPAPPL